jgi:hypothetical protein
MIGGQDLGGLTNSGTSGSQVSGPLPGGLGPGIDNSQIINGDITIGILNMVLLLILLYMYFKSYKSFRSKFTFGLLTFAMLFFIQNLLFTAFLLTQEGFRGPGMGIPIFFLNILEFFALSVLIWVTME